MRNQRSSFMSRNSYRLLKAECGSGQIPLIGIQVAQFDERVAVEDVAFDYFG